MPNPPTPEELEGWEKTAERLWMQSGWSSNEEDEMVRIAVALLAEVKRLREENAKDLETRVARGNNWTAPTGLFPGIMDYEREVIAGNIIRAAAEHDHEKMRFYLTCSVGELAQRVVIALLNYHARSASPKASAAPRTTPRL